MENQRNAQEVFRRSGLTTLPEWLGAGGMTLAVGLAAYHLDQLGSWEAIILAGLPLMWAGGRAIQWFCHTWIVTTDSSLIMYRGVFFLNRRVIDLDSVSQVAVEAAPAGRWLHMGHVAFETIDRQGHRHRYHWTWVHNYRRLYEIILARGQLPIGGPTWWHTAKELAGQWIRMVLGQRTG